MSVWLAKQALKKMAAQAGQFSPLEVGGILLGWRAKEDTIVVDILGPGPKALHGRHMFFPDHEWQMAQIQKIFHQSNGDVDYLGDWHSHPDGEALMSDTDRLTLKRIAKKVPAALMLIVAGDHWHPVCWSGQLSGLLFPTLDVTQQDLLLFEHSRQYV